MGAASSSASATSKRRCTGASRLAWRSRSISSRSRSFSSPAAFSVKVSVSVAPAAAEAEQPKIPSRFGKSKEGTTPAEGPTFRSDAVTVTVDTAVVDNKGHFIPNIPKPYFRILEDGVPQTVTGFSLGEAPMTIALVIEFSNAFQQFYSWGWFQTLEASYGFIQNLRPEDYAAVIAYDLRTEILTDFTAKKKTLTTMSYLL